MPRINLFYSFQLNQLKPPEATLMFLPTSMNSKKTTGKCLKAVTLNQCWLYQLWFPTAGFHSQDRAQAISHMLFLQDPRLESSTIGRFNIFSLYFFWAYYLPLLGMLQLLLVWEMTRSFTKGFHLLKRLMQLGMNIAQKRFCLLGWPHLQGAVALQLIMEVPPGKLLRILAPFHTLQMCLMHIIPLLRLRLLPTCRLRMWLSGSMAMEASHPANFILLQGPMLLEVHHRPAWFIANTVQSMRSFWPTTLLLNLGTLVVPCQQTSMLYWLALRQVSTTVGKWYTLI